MMQSPLARRLVLVTAIKLAALSVIYLLFFGSAARAPIDPVGHIAGAAAPAVIESR